MDPPAFDTVRDMLRKEFGEWDSEETKSSGTHEIRWDLTDIMKGRTKERLIKEW